MSDICEHEVDEMERYLDERWSGMKWKKEENKSRTVTKDEDTEKTCDASFVSKSGLILLFFKEGDEGSFDRSTKWSAHVQWKKWGKSESTFDAIGLSEYRYDWETAAENALSKATKWLSNHVRQGMKPLEKMVSSKKSRHEKGEDHNE